MKLMKKTKRIEGESGRRRGKQFLFKLFKRVQDEDEDEKAEDEQRRIEIKGCI